MKLISGFYIGVNLSKIGKPRTTKGLAVFCARVAEEKIAKNTIIMELTGIDVAPSDYFVICTCDSEVQIKALIDEILIKCRDVGVKRPRIEGNNTLRWVLMDFFDVILHIMLPDTRSFYQLEKLWGDAKFMIIDDGSKTKVVKPTDVSSFYEL